MKLPFKYTLRNFSSRKLTTGITITGIALVVFVFAAVLMMAYGVEKTLQTTGSPDNVVIARKGSNGEISSIIDGDVQNTIRTLTNIARTSDKLPMISNEMVVIININKIEGGLSNVMVRGISPASKYLRPQVKIVQGRMFNQSLREIIVGESISKRFMNCSIGNSIKFAGNQWTIVGVFATNGSGFDSEIWGDGLQLQDAFNRGNAVSTVTLKLDNADNFEKFKREFSRDMRLQEYEPKIETAYFAEQSESLSGFIKIFGTFITIIFSLGATVGAMITMYASVANRTVEIGTLRALGFSRRAVLLVFLIESLVIALSGGAIGIVLASLLQFYSISTLNFNSFSELSFSFALSASIVKSSLIFAAIMGLAGGFLPSVRAARMGIVKALRSE
ncbi:MAG: ABC transporter permease [Ignavibacteria bacterium]